MGGNKDNGQARQCLLESACRVFAEKGSHKARLVDICGEAQANVASGNSHFGRKRKLYDKALRHAFAMAQEIFRCSYSVISLCVFLLHRMPMCEKPATYEKSIFWENI